MNLCREGHGRVLLVAEDFGLSVSISKTKPMVVEREATAADRVPLQVNGTEVQ